jgi:hypothetical protein
MSRRKEAVGHLRKGKRPSEIARTMKVSASTVIQYLFHEVGVGHVRRAEILFTIPPQCRTALEAAMIATGSVDVWVLSRYLNQQFRLQIDRAEIELYMGLRDARIALGDMYELIRDIELTLHQHVRATLTAALGEDWWRDGVPENIRVDCVSMRERDPQPEDDAYCYTTLMSLHKIIDCSWGVISQEMPPHLRGKKKEFLAELSKLNRIRNAVMHPVRGTSLTEADFVFVRHLHAALKLPQWKVQPPTAPGPVH